MAPTNMITEDYTHGTLMVYSEWFIVTVGTHGTLMVYSEWFIVTVGIHVHVVQTFVIGVSCIFGKRVLSRGVLYMPTTLAHMR